jgi:hypothetical protein
MRWEELSALFRDTVAEALPADRLRDVLDLVAGLDKGASPRQMIRCFVACPDWVDAR